MMRLIIQVLFIVSFQITNGFWRNKCPNESSKLYQKANICAILYEDEKCQKGSWRNGFEIPNMNWIAYPLPSGFTYDAESLIVKRGCILKVYSDRL